MTTIHICKWSEFQHFKNRDPIWIKLYRSLRNKREWRTLPAEAAKLLVDLWMLASEQPDPGVIQLSDEDLAWELRMEPAEVLTLLEVIAGHDFITTISSRRQADSPRALAREETEREKETEKETTAAAPPEEVEEAGEGEGDHGGGSDGDSRPATRTQGLTTRESAGALPAYGDGELLDLANRVLGKGVLPGLDQMANKRILNAWLYSEGRDRSIVYDAIEGASKMRDEDLIGWDSAKPGTPMTLKALNGPMTLADQGDGRAKRMLFDVAAEYARRTPPPPKARKRVQGDGLKRVQVEIGQEGAA